MGNGGAPAGGGLYPKPPQTGQYKMGLFFYHFAGQRYEQALQATENVDAPGVAVVHVAGAAA